MSDDMRLLAVGGLALIGAVSVVFHSFSATGGSPVQTKEQREGVYLQRVMSYTRDHGLGCIVPVRFAEGPAAVEARFRAQRAKEIEMKGNPFNFIGSCQTSYLLADPSSLRTEIRRP